MTKDATQAVLDCAQGIKNRDICAFEKLMYGLLMSGLAMQLLGNNIYCPEATVMPGLFVFAARIAQTHNDPVHSGGLVSEQHSFLLWYQIIGTGKLCHNI